MVKAALEATRHGFTLGIVDDVTHTSLPHDDDFRTDHARVRAMFFGLGADGTVGANKHTAKIVGSHTPLHVQAYFVYDSKKSGSTTVSHVRFDDAPIVSTYLVQHANFVACHQFGLLDRIDVLAAAEPGAVFLLNSPYAVDATWDRLPREVQEQIIELGLDVYVIDAHRVARDAGLAGQINTVMQACFFALTDVMPVDDALAAMRESVAAAYGRRGAPIVDANVAAIDNALGALQRLPIPASCTATVGRRPAVAADAPDFVQRVTARMLEGRGDLLPVSAMPVDGEFPTGTARHEKRRLAAEIPVWDPELCIDCARCTLVCPHAAIRLKLCSPDALDGVDLPAKSFRAKEHPGLLLTIQVTPDDCTGCGVCVDVCPAKSKSEVKHKALDMAALAPIADRERTRWQTFLDVTPVAADTLDPATTKGSQTREPLFEFSGACAGCGETPYLKLLTQLFGDHLIVANATGCSSIYGGNLPTTPWSTDARRSWPGVVELPVRGQRRIRSRHAPRARRPDRRSAPLVGRPRTVAPRRSRGVDACRRPPRSRRRRGSRRPTSAASPTSTRRCASSTTRGPGCSPRSRARSCARACGSSAATAGPTTSVPAASTMCSAPAATSTCSCSTPRSIRTPGVRPRRRRRAAPPRSSRRTARPPRRRTSAPRRAATATSTSRRSRSEPTTCKP